MTMRERIDAFLPLASDDMVSGNPLIVNISTGPPVKGFTPVDAHAVHAATGSSAAASFKRKAEELLVVRNKILDRLPEEFHEHRLAYPDYCPSIMGIPVRISETAEPNTIGIESIARSPNLT
jgi:hypothetical protein